MGCLLISGLLQSIGNFGYISQSAHISSRLRETLFQEPQLGSNSEEYMVQNLKWSGAYLRRTLSYALLLKLMKLFPLTATGPEVYVASMTTVLSDYYASLVETLDHFNSLKLKDHPEDNFTDFYY